MKARRHCIPPCITFEMRGGGVLTDGGTVYEKRAEKHSASISAVSGASFVLIGPVASVLLTSGVFPVNQADWLRQ